MKLGHILRQKGRLDAEIPKSIGIGKQSVISL